MKGLYLIAVCLLLFDRQLVVQDYDRSIVMHTTIDSLPIIPYVSLVIEACKKIKHFYCSRHRKEPLLYQDFVNKYPYAISIMHQIHSVQTWLHMSSCGTLPEQIMSRIHLVQSSLCPPFDTAMNQCATKLYESSFDQQGCFVWCENDPARKAYKKFYKKIPQSYQKLAAKFYMIQQDCKSSYTSIVAERVANEYNQKLLDIIYAQIDKNYPRLKLLCRKGYDSLIDKLYDYYVDQNMIEKSVELSEIIVDALHYSSGEQSQMVQHIADTLLKTMIISCEHSDDYQEQIETLYDLLLEQISAQ